MRELTSIERAIAALHVQRATLGDAMVDMALVPLLERRDRLIAGSAAEQRKLVTVLFADLVDFTAVSQALDPEDLRSIVDAYFAILSEAIAREGGVVEKYIGDAVMAVFGLYRAREDDPHRAVRAALALAPAFADLNADVEERQAARIDSDELREGFLKRTPVIVAVEQIGAG